MDKAFYQNEEINMTDQDTTGGEPEAEVKTTDVEQTENQAEDTAAEDAPEGASEA